MSHPIAMVTGSMPPEVCGVGDYTYRLHGELSRLRELELLHIPINRLFEPDLFRVFHRRELVHVQYPTEGWGNSVLPTFMPVVKGRSKLLLTLHEWSQMNRFRRASILPLVSRADGYVFVSEQERQAFLASAPLAARRKPTWVIPIGVNLEVPEVSSQEILAKRRALRGERIISHFGFLHSGKQPEKLLEALTVLRRAGEDARLVFIGDFQKDKPSEREAFLCDIEARGLSDAVTMLGFVKDDGEAARVMAAADVSVSLFNDGLSPRRGSFWYATQHGRPVITTEPSHPESFGDLREHLRQPLVHFVPAWVTGEELAERIMRLPPYEPAQLPKAPVPRWKEIAERHAVVYDHLLGNG